jgi:hypothetical protein
MKHFPYFLFFVFGIVQGFLMIPHKQILPKNYIDYANFLNSTGINSLHDFGKFIHGNLSTSTSR